MNAVISPLRARGLSSSNESRQIMADWLRTARSTKRRPNLRAMLRQRYPAGLLNEAEFEALLDLIED